MKREKREINFVISSKATTPKGISKAIWKNVEFLEKDEFTPEEVEKLLKTGELKADGKTITAYGDVC